ncbi:MAG TPA: ABC transporter permease subunit [Egibacteraceae bacterium]|nr:ABC transporter permease subunit [Egibacteraceae bacterium]
MGRTRAPRLWSALAAVLAGAPLVVLPLRAVADVWRAPAVVPQELGTRGLATLASPGTRAGEAVATSLAVAAAATLLAVLLGWPAARALRDAPRRRRLVLLGLLGLPLLVPPFAVGSGLAVWFLQLGLADTALGLVAGHLVYVLPYVVLLLAAAFGSEVRKLEEVASTLGAGRTARLRFVTVPAAARPLSVAALLGFLVSWSDYGTSLAVGGGRLMLPLVLLPFVGRDPQVASTIALVFLVPPVVALLALRRVWR